MTKGAALVLSPEFIEGSKGCFFVSRQRKETKLNYGSSIETFEDDR
jgi:hypothetical protein